MARQKKRPAENKENAPKQVEECSERQAELLLFAKLVEIVKNRRNISRSEIAFNDIVALLETRMQQISYKFQIPGYSPQDIYQEALFALRYKAIEDYDKGRSATMEISPFDKFAVLCIRRHLSTKLKASYQNKHRVLNTSTSLDQDRGGADSDEVLSLMDIVVRKGDSPDVLSSLDDKEYYKTLFTSLYGRLSDFEREVFVLYCGKYSYEEMRDIINNRHKDQIDAKSVDNALSRIKSKAKAVFRRHG